MDLTKILTAAVVIAAPITLAACQGNSDSAAPQSSMSSTTTMDPSAAGTMDPGLPPSAQSGSTMTGTAANPPSVGAGI